MEILYNALYRLFSKELLNMNIGYDMSISNIRKMMDLVNAIDYIKRFTPSDDEIIKIVQFYEEL